MNSQVHRWYREYGPGIYRFALSILRDPQLAEDVLQETFLRLLSKKILPDPGKERPWLYKVARNLCYDHLRKRNQEPSAPISPPPEENWEFILMLESLPETERQILALRFIGGFTHKEIAGILGLTVHGAKKRYERAIRKLRKELEGLP